MSQLKTKMGRFKTRLATATLALSAITGGVILAGGEAKATVCNFGAGAGAPVCVLNTPIDTNPVPTDKRLTLITTPSNAKGDIEWKWLDKNGNGTWADITDAKVDEWHVDVDLNPDIFPGNPPSVFEYIVKIDQSPMLPYFGDATISALLGPGNGTTTVKKDIYEVGPGDTMGAFIASITTTGGPVTYSFSKLYNQLYIVDTATVPGGGGGIDAYQNTFRQVPGPLPILGAGAAFGFSRRLRSRVKAARLA